MMTSTEHTSRKKEQIVISALNKGSSGLCANALIIIVNHNNLALLVLIGEHIRRLVVDGSREHSDRIAQRRYDVTRVVVVAIAQVEQ